MSLGDVMAAFAPTVAMAVGSGVAPRLEPRRALPPPERLGYVVYTTLPPVGIQAREPLPEFLEQGRELEPVGDVGARYDRLVELFGEPLSADLIWDDDKSKVVWLIEFEDGTWATIYDYEAGTPPSHVVNWRVAGWDEQVLRKVQAHLARAANPLLKQRLLR